MLHDSHKSTFCVWELVPVLHEQQAWERFLRSQGRSYRLDREGDDYVLQQSVLERA